MKPIMQVIRTLLFIVVISAIHIVVAQLLPFPFNKINVAFAMLTLFFLKHTSGIFIWHVFFATLILELYVLTPFGITLASATFAALITYWLYQYMFTNRSLLASMGLVSMFLVVFRSLYTLFLSIAAALSSSITLSYSTIITTALWEIGLTAGLMGIGYMLYLRSIRGDAYIQRAYER